MGPRFVHDCTGLSHKECSTCRPGLSFSQGMCTACPLNTFYVDGYRNKTKRHDPSNGYKTKTKRHDNGSCRACHSKCTSCVGPGTGQCTSCQHRSLPVDWIGSCEGMVVRDDFTSSSQDDIFTVNVLFVAIIMLALSTVIFLILKLRPCKKKAKRRTKFLRSKFKANGSANGGSALHRNGDYRQLPVNPLPVNAGYDGPQVLLESESSTEDEDEDSKRLI